MLPGVVDPASALAVLGHELARRIEDVDPPLGRDRDGPLAYHGPRDAVFLRPASDEHRLRDLLGDVSLGRIGLEDDPAREPSQRLPLPAEEREGRDAGLPVGRGVALPLEGRELPRDIGEAGDLPVEGAEPVDEPVAGFHLPFGLRGPHPAEDHLAPEIRLKLPYLGELPLPSPGAGDDRGHVVREYGAGQPSNPPEDLDQASHEVHRALPLGDDEVMHPRIGERGAEDVVHEGLPRGGPGLYGFLPIDLELLAGRRLEPRMRLRSERVPQEAAGPHVADEAAVGERLRLGGVFALQVEPDPPDAGGGARHPFGDDPGQAVVFAPLPFPLLVDFPAFPPVFPEGVAVKPGFPR